MQKNLPAYKLKGSNNAKNQRFIDPFCLGPIGSEQNPSKLIKAHQIKRGHTKQVQFPVRDIVLPTYYHTMPKSDSKKSLNR
jgi:hypothetical protein